MRASRERANEALMGDRKLKERDSRSLLSEILLDLCRIKDTFEVGLGRDSAGQGGYRREVSQNR